MTPSFTEKCVSLRHKDTIEHYFGGPYRVVDLQPKQVTAGQGGNCFEVEQHCLSPAEDTILRRKFCNFLLKLYCYYDFRLSTDGVNRAEQPAATLARTGGERHQVT